MSANSETKPYDGLIKDLERIHRREKVCKKTINDNIGHIINSLQQSLHTISNFNYSPQDEASQLASQIKSTSDSILKAKPLDEITKAHKEYFAYVSKLGKSIDKTFNKEAQNLGLNSEIQPDCLNSAIAEHYVREGKFHISSTLNIEAQELADQEFEEAMKELHRILNECKNNNFQPATQWAEKNEKALKELNSDLLYELYEFKFNQIHKDQGKDAALKFARENFKKFFPVYGHEIQKLMMSLNPNQICSPANPHTNKEKSEELIGEIAFMACRIYNTTPKSAISLIISTGTLALPKFIKYFSLYSMKLKDWTKEDEIPLSFEYTKENQYHSIFICPVTKEIITEDNPAVMLKCGHVISELATKRIAHINHMKIKCPYCPTDNTISTIKKIYFN